MRSILFFCMSRVVVAEGKLALGAICDEGGNGEGAGGCRGRGVANVQDAPTRRLGARVKQKVLDQGPVLFQSNGPHPGWAPLNVVHSQLRNVSLQLLHLPIVMVGDPERR